MKLAALLLVWLVGVGIVGVVIGPIAALVWAAVSSAVIWQLSRGESGRS